jgi:hypothetical protein
LAIIGDVVLALAGTTRGGNTGYREEDPARDRAPARRDGERGYPMSSAAIGIATAAAFDGQVHPQT